MRRAPARRPAASEFSSAGRRMPRMRLPARRASFPPSCAAGFRRDISAADLRPFLATYTVDAPEAQLRRIHRGRHSGCAAGAGFPLPAGVRSAPARRRARAQSGLGLRAGLPPVVLSCGARIPDDALLDAAAQREAANAGLDAGGPAHARPIRGPSRWPTTLPSNGWVLRGLADVQPDRRLIPNSTRRLRHAFRTETRLFVRSLIRENRSILDLLRADYTYLNEKLAKHYGIDGCHRTGLPASDASAPAADRGGLLTQGSILMLTSHATKTSPVLRGKWILDNLLNSPPPPPPANVPPLDESPANGRKLTTREQVERHRNNPACASCHVAHRPAGVRAGKLRCHRPVARPRMRADRNRPFGNAARAARRFPVRRG